MKTSIITPSRVLHEAAILLEANHSGGTVFLLGCCTSLDKVLRRYTDHITKKRASKFYTHCMNYLYIFQPARSISPSHGLFWWGHPCREGADNNARLLALHFAAAIAESEGN